MVAAKAVSDFVEEESLLQHCAEVGACLMQHLLELQEKYSLIGEVLGMGLPQAIELVRDRQSKEPAGEETAALMEAARRHGLLIGKRGLYRNVIRVTPPMNITRSDVGEFARLLDDRFAEVREAC